MGETRSGGRPRIKPLSVLLGCLLLALALGAQARGYVHDLTGTATVRRTPVAQQPLRIGDIVDEGQTVVTEANSSAIIKFEDGQVMALGPGSSFVIRSYAYNKQRVSASRAAFELLRGALRFITGVIGATNRNAVRLTAGTSTIGIRGTDGTIVFDASTQIVTAAVNAGAIAVSTPLGTQTVGAGSFTRASPGAAPVPPAPVAQAAGVVQQAVGALARQAIPVNTPVSVDASAAAVAAQAQVQALQQQAAQQPANAQLQQQVQQAQQVAAQALSEATASAQAAFQAAIQAGAVPPAPPAPPPATPGTTPTPATPPQAPPAEQPQPAPDPNPTLGPPVIPPPPRDTSASPS